ncbi:alpha/beta fold hydrolase [Sphingomonas sp. BN140010]|uniref:Alpha/beta fold hydrolase n=1 Tax=Sphingomonas arvum TaxID=2992113 RepID=A0ABT3JGF2_9SPHN|nr:alpha/beta fold hydrolase [Sphingomonas sp. BN140010]MCW3798089.1 alpha/beta fold hydrolase [Sphingomonas sp. BN140010]
MATVHTAAGAIGFLEAGSGGVPLVLLHGVGSDKSVWRPQLDEFGAARRTLAFDYPGYGDSAPQPGATRDTYATALWAALDGLGVGTAHLCGLSLGGIVAIAMHAQAPERCASVILADTFAVHPDGQAIYDRSVDASRTIGMRELAKARIDHLLAPGASLELRRELIETMALIDPASYELGAAAVWLADQREQVTPIRCPTLILCGSEDRITPPTLSEELKDRLPHATLVEIAGAGHLPNVEQPAIFNRVLAAFLAGAEANS